MFSFRTVNRLFTCVRLTYARIAYVLLTVFFAQPLAYDQLFSTHTHSMFSPYVGNIFLGTSWHAYRSADVYAFEIIGSTAKQPICRPIPCRTVITDTPMIGGSYSTSIDAEWLRTHPAPNAPLRHANATHNARSYRVNWHLEPEEWDHDPDNEDMPARVVMIVPNSRQDYAGGCVCICLWSRTQALAKTYTGSYCEY